MASVENTEIDTKEVRPSDETDDKKKYTTDDDDDAVGENGESDTVDTVDGIFTRFRGKGHYCPRQEEIQTWGPAVGNIPAPEDTDEFTYLLLTTTNPDRWRLGLRSILKTCSSQEMWQETTLFLKTVIMDGINTIEDGTKRGFLVHLKMAPSSLKMADLWMLLTGLVFEAGESEDKTTENRSQSGREPLTSTINVSVGKATVKALKGFLHFLNNLAGVTYCQLVNLLDMEFGEGQQLLQTVCQLCEGCGIDPTVREFIDDLSLSNAFLMKALGFQLTSKSEVSWQQPEVTSEFDRVLVSLSGLYRSPENVQTSV